MIQQNRKVKLLTFTGLFSALIAIGISIIKIPTGTGYIHFGDAIIYISSIILPYPLGVFASGIGGGFADFLAGYHVYIIPTTIIKMCNSLVTYAVLSKNKTQKLFNLRNIIAVILSGIVTVLGYFLVEQMLFEYGGFAGLYANVVQAIGAVIIFIVLAIGLDKVNILNKI